MIKNKTTENSDENGGKLKPQLGDPASQKTAPIDAATPEKPAGLGRKPLFRN